jgi:hypothetical protein
MGVACRISHLQKSPPGLMVQNLGGDFVGLMQDESGVVQLPERCQYWQNARYLSRYSGASHR